jgi:hypothetical protein
MSPSVPNTTISTIAAVLRPLEEEELCVLIVVLLAGVNKVPLLSVATITLVFRLRTGAPIADARLPLLKPYTSIFAREFR